MKKRILFVEDNPILLEAYALMLENDPAHWEVKTAGDGRAALALMQKLSFDVVVSDMSMPGMTGAQLIKEVRKLYPGMSRIIISGVNDQEEVARSLGMTHQFLAKPFNSKELKATLARIGGLDAYLQNEKLKALVSQVNSLPSFPSLYMQIMKALDADDPSIEDIARIVGKDPGMTAKMLQIVNSAAFGLSVNITSPYDAVQELGFGTVRSLALSAHIFSCYERKTMEGFSIDALWNHSVRTGRLAGMIMQLAQTDSDAVEDAYIAGMLHDVGKLMLAANLPDQFDQALAVSTQRKIPLHEAELEVFGANHAGAAAYLFGLWGLPVPVVEAVAFNYTPRLSELQVFTPLSAVHIANVLEHEISDGPPDGRTPKLDMDYLEAIGVADRIDPWRAQAVKLFEAGED